MSINYSQTVKLSRFLSILLSWKKNFLVKNMVFVCTLAFIAHVTALPADRCVRIQARTWLPPVKSRQMLELPWMVIKNEMWFLRWGGWFVRSLCAIMFCWRWRDGIELVILRNYQINNWQVSSGNKVIGVVFQIYTVPVRSIFSVGTMVELQWNEAIILVLR